MAQLIVTTIISLSLNQKINEDNEISHDLVFGGSGRYITVVICDRLASAFLWRKHNSGIFFSVCHVSAVTTTSLCITDISLPLVDFTNITAVSQSAQISRNQLYILTKMMLQH